MGVQTSSRFAASHGPPGDPRILLYSPDSWGLGHLRRSLTIATALTEAFPRASAMVVTGSPCATQFPRTARVSVVKLPAVTKGPDGEYLPRSLTGSLEFVLRIRSRLLLEAFRAFSPQLVIVDHHVAGLHGEAIGMLREARRTGVRTLLGMRDIIDSPGVVSRLWANRECRWALDEAYDRICVYGSQQVFDPRREYPALAPVSDRVRFTGYIVRRPPPLSATLNRRRRPHVLVTMGGGQDGAERIQTYLQSVAMAPAKWSTSIITGPLMAGREVKQIQCRSRELGHVKVLRFHHDILQVLRSADAVVSMAGYNSSAEILASGVPAVFMPRCFPRQEQLIRAERLERLGLGRCLPNLSPRDLRHLVEEALGRKTAPPIPTFMDGLDRLREISAELLNQPARPVEAGHPVQLIQQAPPSTSGSAH